MIDKRGILVFMSTALATTCDAFSFDVKRRFSEHKVLPDHSREQKSLHAFASDRGESASQYEHFAISSDPSSGSTISQESTTIPVSRPTMARPGENNKLATVDNNTNGIRSAAPPVASKGEGQPIEWNQSVWERNKAADVQGGSLRTWSFANQHKIDMIQVHMKTDGRPMNANVELWHGPDNVPQKVAVYVEDGRARPFRCFIATPYSGNSISIRNTNTLEYPLQAILEGGKVGMDEPETKEKMQRIEATKPKICQGGAVITERFEPEVQSVQVFLQSEGRPLQCRIELIQGPNNVKQVMEVYTEEGSTRPFYTIIETPGYGTGVVRIINSSTLEFPFSATVQPWDIGNLDDDFDAISTSVGSPFFEISGGSKGIGIGNNNLRSVSDPSVDMGGMFGSFPISGSQSSPTQTKNVESQEGGLSSLFESPVSVPSPSPVLPVKRKMISPKKSIPLPATEVESEAELSPIFLQNEEFANSSSTSSLSQDTEPIVPTRARSRASSPKKLTFVAKLKAHSEVLNGSDAEPNSAPESIQYDPPPSPTLSPASDVAKKYVPASPTPQERRSHVLLDIDDAYK